MMTRSMSRALVGAIVLGLGATSLPAWAISFDFDEAGDWTGVLNTTITAGAAWRMQDRASDLIGKGDLNPKVCAGQQVCQGLFRLQSQPALTAAAAPGAFTMNSDDGDLNYGKHDLVSGVTKITQDLTIKHGDFGLFVKGLYFYDAVNKHFTENHPDRIAAQNLSTVAHTDALMRNVYSYGAQVRSRRSGSATLSQIGSEFQLLDANVYGKLPLGSEHSLTFKVGRQLVNWGESTLNVIGSINSANPVNANNLYRIGTQVEEVFTPVNMVFLGTDLAEGLTAEAFYQLEWKPLEAPAAGSFYSSSDIVGTHSAVNWANASFGTSADDPDKLGWLLDNPLSAITPTTLSVGRLTDHSPKTAGQYGIALKYYAEWLNDGTALGLYYENYHSRLPYASAFATRASCARGADSVNGWDPALSGNSGNGNATNIANFLIDCPNVPLLAQLPVAPITSGLYEKWSPGAPLYGTDPKTGKMVISDALPLDTANLWIEYPEDIHLLGLSFNTTVGSVSLQGEVAYRPNQPLQVNPIDVVFAALGPTLTACHRDNCLGSNPATTASALQAALGNPTAQGVVNALGGPGSTAQIAQSTGAYGGSDTNQNCLPGNCDTFSLLVGHLDGSGRSFPNFIMPYRGRLVGENSPTDFSKPLNQKNPGYIQGYERFKTLQFDLGATSVLGASDMLPSILAADQILLLYEVGATWVPGLPSLDRLQIISDGGAFTSATAGADGSGADGSRQACGQAAGCIGRNTAADNPSGYDGLRFNPHQAPLSDFATKLAWGYNVIAMIRYESVLPGISLQPQIIIKHDVNGNAPGPGENFLGGRKVFDVLLETRYKSAFSWSVGYNWITGGGSKNQLRDRDALRTFFKYQF